MKQFKTVFLFELKGLVMSRGYLINTAVLALIVILSSLAPRLINSLTGTSSSDDQGRTVRVCLSEQLAYKEGSKENYRAAFEEAFPQDDIVIVVGVPKEQDLLEALQNDSIERTYVVLEDLSYIYYTKSDGLNNDDFETGDTAVKNAYISSSLQGKGVDPDYLLNLLSSEVTHELRTAEEDKRANFLFAYVMVMLLYAVILYYGQGVATSVAAEKSSRTMELLITSIRTTPLIFGKILAFSLAGLIQLLCLFAVTILSFQWNASYKGSSIPVLMSFFQASPDLMGYMLVFFVLGFLVYAFLYGAVGSTVTKLEETGTAVMPITWLFIIGFFVTILSLTSGAVDTVPVKVFSYIPFASPMVMFARIAMSDVSGTEFVLSILILAVTVIFTGILAAKVYRTGVMIYGNRPNLLSLIKIMLKAD